MKARRLADIKGEFLTRSEDARQAWDRTSERRALGAWLTGLRSHCGLSQTEIAHKTGWDKSYVSRLEGATDGFPSLTTLARYADACGQRFALATYYMEAAGRPTLTSLLPVDGNQNAAMPEAAREERVAASAAVSAGD